MKKICIISCGGRITMKRNKHGVLAPYHRAKEVLDRIPEIFSLADITLLEVANIDSTNIHPDLWTQVIQKIQEHYHSFDGFIVIHGTDTMAYTASALSFALRNLSKPIVFTGSQKPFDDIPSDVNINVINAVKVACMDIPEVCIVFGTKILRGNRATKMSETNLEAFESPMAPFLGEIMAEPKVNIRFKNKKRSTLSVQPIFDPQILVVTMIPGMSSDLLASIIPPYHGFIFRAYGAGNIPDAVLPQVKQAVELNIPVVILSQCGKGITQMQLYTVGQHAYQAGAISGYDMTLEAATAKLMWALGRTRDVKKIRDIFQTNIAGEVSLPD